PGMAADRRHPDTNYTGSMSRRDSRDCEVLHAESTKSLVMASLTSLNARCSESAAIAADWGTAPALSCLRPSKQLGLFCALFGSGRWVDEAL
ncbi:MAG: hypothetical protein ACREVH_07315, partial [Gammaproteobacteria bacterium]